MSNNRAIAESLGWKIEHPDWMGENHYLLYMPDGRQMYDGGMSVFTGESIDEAIPDFEHDLNDAIELMKQMPLIEVFYDGKRWCVAAVVPVYGTDLARAICEAYCRLKGIAIPEGEKE